jgi:hypothetical protein
MSVLMTLRVQGDATQLEALAASDETFFSNVSEKGRQMGATAHHFYATDTEILVIDEWPDKESFEAFFHSTPEIPKVMAQAGVTSEPEITFYRMVDLGDSFG